MVVVAVSDGSEVGWLGPWLGVRPISPWISRSWKAFAKMCSSEGEASGFGEDGTIAKGRF